MVVVVVVEVVVVVVVVVIVVVVVVLVVVVVVFVKHSVGDETPTMLLPGIVGMRGSMVLKTTKYLVLLCLAISTPPPPPVVPKGFGQVGRPLETGVHQQLGRPWETVSHRSQRCLPGEE